MTGETTEVGKTPEVGETPEAEMRDGTLRELGDYIQSAHATDITGYRVSFGELNLEVPVSALVKVARFLKSDTNCLFEMLIDICGVDYPERNPRYEVVYNLLSMRHNQRVRLKVPVDESTPVPSLAAMFPTATWFERECWDLYGLFFSDHPDLRRLLTDYGFDGHPFRKDFPLTGYVEVRYDDESRRVIYEPVKLPQEFRNFDFLSPWEGAMEELPGDEKAIRENEEPKERPEEKEEEKGKAGDMSDTVAASKTDGDDR